jgi:tetratricopeptide (TPR) repeat protein
MNSTTTTSAGHELINEKKIQGSIVKNKIAIYTIFGVVVALVVGFGLFKTFADKSNAEYNTKIFAFESTILKDYIANPTDPKAAKTLLDGVGNLNLLMGDYLGLLPVVIKSSDALMANSQYTEARSILAIGESIANDGHSKYFILSRQAVVYEDLGEDKLAIETLEKMTSQSVKIFEGKTYLDLGRLYLKIGNKEKAKASFTHVVEKAKDEIEFVKVAQLYLAKM